MIKNDCGNCLCLLVYLFTWFNYSPAWDTTIQMNFQAQRFARYFFLAGRLFDRFVRASSAHRSSAMKQLEGLSVYTYMGV